MASKYLEIRRGQEIIARITIEDDHHITDIAQDLWGGKLEVSGDTAALEKVHALYSAVQFQKREKR